jgi:hypothetical protein
MTYIPDPTEDNITNEYLNDYSICPFCYRKYHSDKNVCPYCLIEETEGENEISG